MGIAEGIGTDGGTCTGAGAFRLLAIGSAGPTYWIRTLAIPSIFKANAAPWDKSIIRFPTNGPRSLRRTTNCFPLLRLVTQSKLFKGKVLWAAVKASLSNISPVAVGFP